MKSISITFFGDSIFTGQGVSIYKSWISRMGFFLEQYEKKIGENFLLTNSSVNGRTTRQAIEDFQYHVQPFDIDILIVQFGLNDCNYWVSDKGLPRVSVGAYIENLKEIVKRSEKFNIKRILLNNNHPTTRNKTILPGTNITFEDSNKEFSFAIQKLANHLGPKVKFQNIYEKFLQSADNTKDNISDYVLDDGLHLSEKGHELYFNIMQPVITDTIQEIVNLRI